MNQSLVERKDSTNYSRKRIKRLIEDLKPAELALNEKITERDKTRKYLATEHYEMDEIEKKMYSERSKLILQDTVLQSDIETLHHSIRSGHGKAGNLKEEISELESEIVGKENEFEKMEKANKNRIAWEEANILQLNDRINTFDDLFSHFNSESEIIAKENKLLMQNICELKQELKKKEIFIDSKRKSTDKLLENYLTFVENSPKINLKEKIESFAPDFRILKEKMLRNTETRNSLDEAIKSNDDKFYVVIFWGKLKIKGKR